MRKKIEEQLAKLAFGDLEAEEASNLEIRAKDDPEAARTLQMYCRMKDELRSLSLDVPADQLSKERLREAILTRGLEHRKASSKPTWLWMPAAAAVLAFGVVFMKGYRPVGNVAPTVVENSKPGLKMPELVIPMTVDTEAVERVAKRLAAAKEAPLFVYNTEPSRRYNRDRIGLDRNERVDAPGGLPDKWLDASAEGPTPKELRSTPDFGASKPVAESLEKKDSEPAPPVIVVIQPETDKDTGTLKAKEIGNTTNFVVGG